MASRRLTIQPQGKENVFGAVPWIISLPRAKGREPRPCQGRVLKRSSYRRCKNHARWAYADLSGEVRYVCFSHVHTGLLGTDDEQERLEKWKRQVGYYRLGNEDAPQP